MHQGFDRMRVEPVFGVLENDRMARALADELLALDPERPLFLFLNLSEAHQLWDAVPEGHPWLPPRPATNNGSDDQYWQGDAARRAAYLEHIEPLYAYGVQRADQTLARCLALLEREGWLAEGSRLVLTTDHGELLGEHGWIDHGKNVYEPNNRAPLIAVGADLPQLPALVNAMEVHPLLLRGELGGFPAEAAAFHSTELTARTDGEFGTSDWLARWQDREKLRWKDGEIDRVDLAADPGELSPEPASSARLEALGQEVERARVAADGELDPALQELLKAAGYLD